MKKHAAAYITAIALVSFAIIPSVASAAWWNPLSWGRTIPVTAPVMISAVSVPETASTTPVEPPAVITKTVTVSDPAQAAKITALMAQVSDLNSQISALTSENASLNAQVASLTAQVQSIKTGATAPVLDLSLEKSNLMVRYEQAHPKPDCSSSAGLIAAGFGGSIKGQPGPNAASECLSSKGNYSVLENAWVNAQMQNSLN